MINQLFNSESLWLCDRSDWGVLQLTGSDRLRFLHNQTTNDILALKPGQGCDTVFVTSTARTLDLATAYITDQAILMVVSPQRKDFLLSWLDRYIFPMDQVQLQDISSSTAILTLLGKPAPQLVAQLVPYCSLTQEFDHTQVSTHSLDFRLAMGSGLAIQGYTVLCSREQKPQILEMLRTSPVKELTSADWEHLRIIQGRPAPDQELTQDYNPLEAGLLHTISLNKGCYIGQETIARLHTYKGVKQRLWGISLPNLVPVDSPVTVDGTKVGVITSCTPTATGSFCLAYVKSKAGGEGLEVEVGDDRGKIVSVPFLHRGLDLSTPVLDHP